MKIRECSKNGKIQFMVEFTLGSKRKRKFFHTKKDANLFVSDFNKSKLSGRATLLSLPDETIRDIVEAIRILPMGCSLTETVNKLWQYNSKADIKKLADDFIQSKIAKGVSNSHIVHTKSRLNKFCQAFQSFEKATPNAILEYIKSRGAQKTVLHYKGTLQGFFAFCLRKDAITANPFDKLSFDDFFVEQKPHEIEFLKVEQAKSFLEFIETKYPQYARFYALAMFAGVRVAEVTRMKDEYFRYDEKKIVFPAQIGKIKKAWTLEDLPDNLWAWLEKYKDTPILRPSDYVRSETFKNFKLPHNFTRHSFATYHLSLYFDVAKTSKITRNSEQMLKDHYWGALVDKKTAEAYFEILPKV